MKANHPQNQSKHVWRKNQLAVEMELAVGMVVVSDSACALIKVTANNGPANLILHTLDKTKCNNWLKRTCRHTYY